MIGKGDSVLGRSVLEFARAVDKGAGQRVGVCLRRSPELAVALLGVLKAGSCCLPLDPGYPAED